MAAAALTPRVRIMAICDGVRESKIEAGVFHLKGVRQGVTTRAFPSVPMRLWLFLVLSSPQPGEFPAYIAVVHDRTDKTIFFRHFEPKPVFEMNDEVLPGHLEIRCTFPEEGRYTVQVWFFQQQGSDVLKGELPFTVEQEGA